ncbi:MAG: DUF3347 domain-containing protein [Bacteroidota bacterium]
MKSYLKLLIGSTCILFQTACNGKINNAKTVTVSINGNCEMCKETIEKAANKKNMAELVWNIDTKIAQLTYDSIKTNRDEILKRVAYAGYDNELFLAPDDAYSKLPSCCKYERTGKTKPVESAIVKSEVVSGVKKDSVVQVVKSNQLQSLFNAYFELKNALVKTNSDSAAVKAKLFSNLVANIDMTTLESKEHVVWMKVYKSLTTSAESIGKSKDVEAQRVIFMALSKDMYDLIKVAKLDKPVYYQHCPMYNDGKGANWLSLENAVKNPYYGSQMLNCGKTVEVIK